jgi:hypothetical protein
MTGGGHGTSEALRGSGRIIERRVDVDAFDRLSIETAFEVVLRTDDATTVTLEVDDNLAEVVVAVSRAGELRLGLEDGATVEDATLRAVVTTPTVSEVSVSGASAVRFDEVRARDMTLDVSGASVASGSLSADDFRVRASGSSAIDLAGRARRLELAGSGTCSIDLSRLECDDASVDVGGTVRARTHVRRSLSARAAGVAVVEYAGGGAAREIETTGLARVEPR